MIAYVAITALVNLALGYGLALYLGRGTGRFFARRAEAHYDALHDERTLTPGKHLVELARAVDAAAAAANAAQPAQSPNEPEVEQEVLAGIEEFRNQLAQMKDKPLVDDDVSLDAVEALT